MVADYIENEDGSGHYEEIIDGKRYSTRDDKADLMATNNDANAAPSNRTLKYLYKTKKGAFFVLVMPVQKMPRIETLERDDAMKLWEQMKVRFGSYTDVFGLSEEDIEDA